MRSTTVLSTVLSLALLSKEVLATPPACLLACVAQVTSGSSQCNTLSNLNCVCSNEDSAVKSCLDSICPNGNADAAYSAFKSSCSEQNISLGDSSSSAVSSSASSSTQASSSSSSAHASSSAQASSSAVVESSTHITSSSAEASVEAHSTTSSSTEAPAASSTITSVQETTTSHSTTSTSSAKSTTHSAITISQGSANLLQLGGSLAAVAAAALLI